MRWSRKKRIRYRIGLSCSARILDGLYRLIHFQGSPFDSLATEYRLKKSTKYVLRTRPNYPLRKSDVEAAYNRGRYLLCIVGRLTLTFLSRGGVYFENGGA